MSDVLARGVIEVGVDEMRLQDELSSAQGKISKTLSATVNQSKAVADQQQKVAKYASYLRSVEIDRVRLSDAQVRNTIRLANATKWHTEIIKKLTYEPVMRKFFFDNPAPGRREKVDSFLGKASSHLNDALAFGGGLMATGAGAAYAAAAISGSTTMNTLTESIKMLSLAVGAKTQSSVMKLSRGIQSMAHAVDKASSLDVLGGIGGVGGAIAGWQLSKLLPAFFKHPIHGALMGGAIGLGGGMAASGQQAAGFGMMGAAIGTMGGPWGTAIGGGAGYLYGLIKETKFTGDYVKDMAYRFARDPGQVGTALGRAAVLDKQPGAHSADAADMLRKAVAMSEAIRKADPDSFKTAGLNLPASYVGLADVRQQAQMAAVSRGPAEMENFIKELGLNRQALEESNRIARERMGNIGNVQPPTGN